MVQLHCTDDLRCCIDIYKAGGYTLVLCRGESLYTSTLRGIAPLVDILAGEASYKGYSATDKIVGRAAAFLYTLIGIKELYSSVISRGALSILAKGGIAVYYGALVEGIVNRQGTGPCPMEKACLGIVSPKVALEAIKATLRSLRGGSSVG